MTKAMSEQRRPRRKRRLDLATLVRLRRELGLPDDGPTPEMVQVWCEQELDEPVALAEVRGCGTRNGYLRHLRRSEQACDPCMDANAAYRRDRYTGSAGRNREYQSARRIAVRRLRQLHPRDWRALLTEEWGRMRDRYTGSPAERNRLYNQARRVAERRLKGMHPGSWRALLAEELDQQPVAEAG